MRVTAAITFALSLQCTAASAQSSPAPAVPSTPATMPSSAPGVPANLCQELVTFVRGQESAQSKAPTAPALAVAVNAPKAQEEVAKPPAAGITQQNSGLSGQIPTAGGPGASGPQGAAQNQDAPAGSTATATAPAPAPAPTPPQAPAPAAAAAAPPAAAGAPPSPKPMLQDREQVEAAARGNDLGACRAAAQQMRGAGVALPAPLIALAAMDLKLLERASPPSAVQP